VLTAVAAKDCANDDLMVVTVKAGA
jgi:hypothetical protein